MAGVKEEKWPFPVVFAHMQINCAALPHRNAYTHTKCFVLHRVEFSMLQNLRSHVPTVYSYRLPYFQNQWQNTAVDATEAGSANEAKIHTLTHDVLGCSC